MPEAARGLQPAVSAEGCRALGQAAVRALFDELSLAPKPGLVSFEDNGSHADMNAQTFMRSLRSLRHYFPQIAALGAQRAPFAALQAAGLAAEQRMLAATSGINTHRGAVFALGLLCAAGGALQAHGRALTPPALRAALQARWGQALSQRARLLPASHGVAAVQRHGLRGANEEAAAGMPALFEAVWPALRAALLAGWGWERARLQALFAAMATLDDTNLVHRGGLAGLRDVQAAARSFLQAGGAGRADAVAHARELHRALVARHLSPGGSADLLAAACWLQRVCVASMPPP